MTKKNVFLFVFLMLFLISFSQSKNSSNIDLSIIKKEAALIKTPAKYSLEEYVSQAEKKSASGLDGDSVLIPFTIENTVNSSSDMMPVRGGIPLPIGVIKGKFACSVYNNTGNLIPSQVDTRAYWPDGSIKWLLVDFNVDQPALSKTDFSLHIYKELSTTRKTELQVSETSDYFLINTGKIEFQVNKNGDDIFKTICLLKPEGNVKVLTSKNKSRLFTEIIAKDGQGSSLQKYESVLTGKEEVFLEEAGSERAIICIKGIHYSSDKGEFAPYTLRIYAHEGSSLIRFAHSYIYTGDPEKDFIHSIGIRITTDIDDVESFSISSDKGLGHTIPYNPGSLLPDWTQVLLTQNGSNGFTIKKWINPEQNSPVNMMEGERSLGWAKLSSKEASISMGIKNFWQEYPKAISLNAEKQEFIAYLYSPYGGELDLRRYSNHTYSELYETSFRKLKGIGDVQPVEGWEDYVTTDDIGARYIGKTSEFFIDISPSTDNRHSAKQALFFQNPLILATSPDWIAKTRVFGDFAPLNNEFIKKFGHPLDETIDFLSHEPEYRKWYSFLDYGDMVHSFDPGRDIWRKDEGGYAWNNNEHCILEGLWNAYLHSGNTKLFRVAEAMTRHVNDVDMYHDGPLAGNGSRHNVNHYGCVCKKRRMTLPENKRIYYYLTGDEHTRDIIHFVYNSFLENKTDEDLMKTGRNIMDLGVYSSGVLFLWETTGDKKYGELLKNTTETMCDFRVYDRGFPQKVRFEAHTGKGSPAEDPMFLQTRSFLMKFGPMDLLLNSVELTKSQKVHQAILDWAEITLLPDSLGKKYQRSYSKGMDCGRAVSYAYKYTESPDYLALLNEWTGNHEVWFETIGNEDFFQPDPHKIPRNDPRNTSFEQAANEKFQLRGMADLLRNAPYCYYILIKEDE